MNSWWEIQIFCNPDLGESIFWQLERFGCQGTASEMKGEIDLIRAYLPQSQADLASLRALAELLWQDAQALNLALPEVHWHLINEEDWSSSWKQHWHPQEVGDRLLIYPAWLPLPKHANRLILRLDPGMAFGTGTHPTTQLCLEALEVRLGATPPGTIVADIGCGSGILSVGAILLGAQKVDAVDTDPLAVTATGANRDLNEMNPNRITVHKGSLEHLSQELDGPIDGFLCNILAEVIIDLVPRFEAIAKPETWGILSGMLIDQTEAVTNVLVKHGWEVTARQCRENWSCLQIQRA